MHNCCISRKPKPTYQPEYGEVMLQVHAMVHLEENRGD